MNSPPICTRLFCTVQCTLCMVQSCPALPELPDTAGNCWNSLCSKKLGCLERRKSHHKQKKKNSGIFSCFDFPPFSGFKTVFVCATLEQEKIATGRFAYLFDFLATRQWSAVRLERMGRQAICRLL